jgi:redox-sensitive bicupin YhaK (pirin superfamily)
MTTSDDTASADASGVELEIAGRTRDLGDGFIVRRLLPASARRTVGPFIFVDHMGPVQLDAGRGLDVRPHPHINLATVTYLFEGEILHRDSIGSEQLLLPGAVNWMTAGRGIVHSERSPAAARKSGARVHGLQTWVALPRAREEVEPSFQHRAAGDVPDAHVAGARLRVIAGAAYGVTAPVAVLSPLFYVEARLDAGAALPVGAAELGAGAERAAYVVAGAVACGGRTFGAGALVVLRAGGAERIEARGAAHVVLLGGAPLDGERHIWWNFVSSSPERIERAKDDWRAERFPTVPGDAVERIPLPQ